ncbi:IS3 family transposase [Halomonas eurihalina]
MAVCSALAASRSALYHHSQAQDQRPVLLWIQKVTTTRVRYGYRRVHALFKREGRNVSHKRVYRLYRETDLSLQHKQARRRPDGCTSSCTSARHGNGSSVEHGLHQWHLVQWPATTRPDTD